MQLFVLLDLLVCSSIRHVLGRPSTDLIISCLFYRHCHCRFAKPVCVDRKLTVEVFINNSFDTRLSATPSPSKLWA